MALDNPNDPFDIDWRERLLALGVAFGALAVATVIGLIYRNEQTLELFGLVPASIFAIGKFLPLWGATGESHFSPWQLGGVIWILDTYTVLIVVYGMEAFYKIGPLKRWLTRIQHNANLVLTAYPRMRRGAIVAVIIFVLFPLAGTGALVGAFLGILLGLNRFALIGAVSLGGILGGMLMAYLATHFGGALQSFREAQQNPATKALIIAGVVIVVGTFFYFVNRLYKKALAEAEAQLSRQDIRSDEIPAGDNS